MNQTSTILLNKMIAIYKVGLMNQTPTILLNRTIAIYKVGLINQAPTIFICVGLMNQTPTGKLNPGSICHFGDFFEDAHDVLTPDLAYIFL